MSKEELKKKEDNHSKGSKRKNSNYKNEDQIKKKTNERMANFCLKG